MKFKKMSRKKAKQDAEEVKKDAEEAAAKAEKSAQQAAAKAKKSAQKAARVMMKFKKMSRESFDKKKDMIRTNIAKLLRVSADRVKVSLKSDDSATVLIELRTSSESSTVEVEILPSADPKEPSPEAAASQLENESADQVSGALGEKVLVVAPTTNKSAKDSEAPANGGSSAVVPIVAVVAGVVVLAAVVVAAISYSRAARRRANKQCFEKLIHQKSVDQSQRSQSVDRSQSQNGAH